MKLNKNINKTKAKEFSDTIPNGTVLIQFLQIWVGTKNNVQPLGTHTYFLTELNSIEQNRTESKLSFKYSSSSKSLVLSQLSSLQSKGSTGPDGLCNIKRLTLIINESYCFSI